MAQFKTDLRDIYFNLFNVLKIQNHTGVLAEDMKDIINECNKFIEKEIEKLEYSKFIETITFEQIKKISLDDDYAN